MNTTRTRLLGALAIVGLVVGLGAASAGAGSISRSITVDPTTVPAGGTFTVSGGPDCTESLLVITVADLGLSEEVDGTADWTAEFTAPADAEPGTYLVTVENSECNFGDGSIIITAAPVSTTTTAPAAVAAAAATAPSFTG
jgi:hypothetical protein